MIEYHLDHLYSYNATLQIPFEVIGPTPEGIRLNAYVTGGEARGRKSPGNCGSPAVIGSLFALME